MSLRSQHDLDELQRGRAQLPNALGKGVDVRLNEILTLGLQRLGVASTAPVRLEVAPTASGYRSKLVYATTPKEFSLLGGLRHFWCITRTRRSIQTREHSSRCSGSCGNSLWNVCAWKWCNLLLRCHSNSHWRHLEGLRGSSGSK